MLGFEGERQITDLVYTQWIWNSYKLLQITTESIESQVQEAGLGGFLRPEAWEVLLTWKAAVTMPQNEYIELHRKHYGYHLYYHEKKIKKKESWETALLEMTLRENHPNMKDSLDLWAYISRKPM